MTHAPRKLATAILVCRSLAVILEAAALTYSMTAPDLSFSTLIFLRMFLSVHMSLSVVRLLYDAAQVFMHEPLPADGWLMATLVVSEFILLPALLAAAASSAAVVQLLYHDLRKCDELPPYFCARYGAAVLFTLAAWAIHVPIAFMMAWIGAFWDLAAQDAAAAAAAAEAEAEAAVADDQA